MIDLTITDDVAHVVLNAPHKRNALDVEALTELGDAYDAAEAAGVRALVLRGEGAGFCAGRDIAGVDPATDDVTGYLSRLVTPVLQKMSA
ncbi:MAG: enoyl-CoA hydratase/isomerase family protein, partial [Actinomycetota bacterium]